MNRILLIVTVFIVALTTSVSAQETEGVSKFNPEDTWMYRVAHMPDCYYGDELSTVFEEQLYEMKVIDEVELDGKKYYRLSWSIKGATEENHNRYFYLREENGAYYSYILDPVYSEDDSPYHPNVKTGEGEYLIYDFNMEFDDTYIAPICTYRDKDDLSIFKYQMVKIYVFGKRTDNEGRRVLNIMCEQLNRYAPSFNDIILTIVEGFGPLSPGNIATVIVPEMLGMSTNPTDMHLESVTNTDGKEIYLSDLDIKAGFCEERNYTWVYAMFDKNGDARYHKMGFNYFPPKSTYRRFGTLGVSKNPDGDWEKTDFNRYYVREENGKVWLYHTENSMHFLNGSYAPRLESLIYDFGVPDGEELTFYSPRGEKTAKIATGLTEVGGEDMLSYTFEGSDGVKCVEGIGITKGGILPAVNTEFHGQAWTDESYVGCVLIAVYDGDGNLIFRQDLPSEIETVNADNGFVAPSDRLFDLQGRELREPMPGQPYIKGGKIFVETN